MCYYLHPRQLKMCTSRRIMQVMNDWWILYQIEIQHLAQTRQVISITPLINLSRTHHRCQKFVRILFSDFDFSQKIKDLEDKKLDTQKKFEPDQSTGYGAMIKNASKVRLKLVNGELVWIRLCVRDEKSIIHLIANFLQPF